MRSNVINFRLKDRPNRLRAMGWLVNNIDIWPTSGDILGDNFHGWRFLETDGEVIFCDFVHPCIYESEFIDHMQLLNDIQK